jgi:asparagine synthase (glutamine-hydrolysing)
MEFHKSTTRRFFYKKGGIKNILKESFKEYFPKDFLNKSKKGFGVPVGLSWLKKKNCYLILIKRLLKSKIYFILKQFLLLVNHLQGKIDNTFRVWTFYCFQNGINKRMKSKTNFIALPPFLYP